MTVGIIVGVLGVMFAVVSLTGAAMTLAEWRLVGRLRTAPRLTSAELHAATRLPRRVLVTGRTAPGHEGELRSPVCDAACVWFETEVSGDPDGEVGPTRYMHLTRGGPIAIADHSGLVLADLRLVLSHDSRPFVQTHAEDTRWAATEAAPTGGGFDRLQEAGLLRNLTSHDDRKARALHLQEDYISPGRDVAVLARPRLEAGAVLVGKPGLVFGGGVDEWTATVRASVAEGVWFSRWVMLRGMGMAALGSVVLLIDARSGG